jgi:hypothetical protein
MYGNHDNRLAATRSGARKVFLALRSASRLNRGGVI